MTKQDAETRQSLCDNCGDRFDHPGHDPLFCPLCASWFEAKEAQGDD